MKILRLAFSNLNSLAGTWEIDFTLPIFTQSGIFVITGPTGSGKTTILDAICLALYGRTPRLGKITESSNHIMTRHRGFCSAEVMFESQKGRFICHWSQNRARNKPDGKLQEPSREISRADTGEILACKRNEVQEAIEDATGMSYDQFTKSILLAQGAFAAFLQAKEDERAPILEQITRTSIYSELSIKAHKRHAREKERLELISQDLARITVLTPEEIADIHRRIGELEDTISKREEEIAQITNAINWLESLERLEEEITKIEGAATVLAEKKAAFEPSRKVLSAAQTAAAYQGLYTELTLKRKNRDADVTHLHAIDEEITAIEESLPTHEAVVRSAQEEVEQAEQEETDGLLRIQTVRNLDTEIADREAELTQNHDDLRRLERLVDEANERFKAEEKRKEQILKEKSLSAHYIEQNAIDGTIRDFFSGISYKAEEIGLEKTSIAQNTEECAHLGDALREIEQDLQRIRKRREDCRASLQKGEEQHRICENQLKNLLSGATLKELRQAREEYRCRFNELDTCKETLLSLLECSTNLRDLLAIRETLMNHLQRDREELDRITTELHTKEEGLAIKKQAAIHAGKVRDFAVERKSLIPGTPCPLCGARDHPYADGLIIEPDAIIKDFEDDEQEIKELTSQLTNITALIAQKETELSRCRADLSKQEAELQKIQARFEEQKRTLGILTDCDLDTLNATLNAVQGQGADIEARISLAEGYEDQIKQSQQRLLQMRERLTTLDNEVRDTENTLARTQSRIEQVRKLISTGQMKINRHIEEIRPIVEGFGYTIDQDTNFTALILTLTQRQQRFQKEEERIQQCEQDLRAVENVLSSLGGEIQGKREEISRLSKRVEEQGRLLAERKDERYRLLGDRDAEEEERRLSERVAAAKRVFEAARATWDERMRVLQTHQGIKDDLNRRVDAANEEISRLEETFLSRIMEAGFADEAAYAAALMPPDEIARLAQVWDEISTEEMRIHERQMDAARRYQKERERNLSTLPKEQLLQERDAMHNEKNACLAEIGQYRERLVQDEERSRQQAQTLAERERQQRETDRWGRLDTLIGSADGKHFRNFAQGLTFSILLSHANRHLRRMTDRYILIQDTTMPLTMHVIDTWQGGVVRTVKNLSGGEVFLVSLALALGLSGMASQNVRVDSLFLDEGFGTLDNDTLETALSALSSLEQEGKLIGIISHVPALQERIPVRISIEKGTNGTSRIILPAAF